MTVAVPFKPTLSDYSRDPERRRWQFAASQEGEHLCAVSSSLSPSPPSPRPCCRAASSSPAKSRRPPASSTRRPRPTNASSPRHRRRRPAAAAGRLRHLFERRRGAEGLDQRRRPGRRSARSPGSRPQGRLRRPAPERRGRKRPQHLRRDTRGTQGFGVDQAPFRQALGAQAAFAVLDADVAVEAGALRVADPGAGDDAGRARRDGAQVVDLVSQRDPGPLGPRRFVEARVPVGRADVLQPADIDHVVDVVVLVDVFRPHVQRDDEDLAVFTRGQLRPGHPVLSFAEGDALLDHQGLKLAGLEHLAHDVRPADKLALHIELGDGGPVGEALDAVAQALVLKHIDADEGRAHVVEDLHRQRGEAAARRVRRALHEQDHVMLGHGLGDEGVDGVGGLGSRLIGHGARRASGPRHRPDRRARDRGPDRSGGAGAFPGPRRPRRRPAGAADRARGRPRQGQRRGSRHGRRGAFRVHGHRRRRPVRRPGRGFQRRPGHPDRPRGIRRRRLWSPVRSGGRDRGQDQAGRWVFRSHRAGGAGLSRPPPAPLCRPRRRQAPRLAVRRLGPEVDGAAAVAGPEDAGRGPAGRRRGPRLQQPADRHPDAAVRAAGAPPDRDPRRRPGAQAAGLLAQVHGAARASGPGRTGRRVRRPAAPPAARRRASGDRLRPRHAPGPGRQEPAGNRRHEPGGQRPRRHARRGRAGRGRPRHGLARGQGRGRPDRGVRHRPRRADRTGRQDLRALLHHQGGQRRHRHGPSHRLRHCPAGGRPHQRDQYRRPDASGHGRRLPHLPARRLGRGTGRRPCGREGGQGRAARPVGRRPHPVRGRRGRRARHRRPPAAPARL
uniref:LigA n=1 Tax=Parastrongyloides trichosuri TaxID=131310 RepID=A0A0N4ZXX1_PARTI